MVKKIHELRDAIDRAFETANDDINVIVDSGSFYQLILNTEDDQRAVDLKLATDSLDITVFFRDPYQVVQNGYTRITYAQYKKLSAYIDECIKAVS